MNPMLLAFSGPMRSGTSYMSQQVAEILAWPRASFGEYIRGQARNKGLSEDREVLQHLGSSLIETKGWQSFCGDVLAQSNWSPGKPLVVDGIRHREALETIQRLTELPEKCLVHVDMDQRILAQRLLGQEVATVEELQRVEADPTEAQVKTILPAMADLTVDGTQPADQLVQEIIDLVEQYTSTANTNKIDNPLEAARLRGARNKEQLLEAEGGTLEADAVARLLGTPEEVVETQRCAGKLIGLPVNHHVYVYPKWQFQDGGMLPGLEPVLAALYDHDVWMQTAFMLNENTYLQGQTPLAMLQEGRVAEVLGAARSYGEHGAA